MPIFFHSLPYLPDPEVADPRVMALLLAAVALTLVAARSREALVGLVLTGLVAAVVFLGPLPAQPSGYQAWRIPDREPILGDPTLIELLSWDMSAYFGRPITAVEACVAHYRGETEWGESLHGYWDTIYPDDRRWHGENPLAYVSTDCWTAVLCYIDPDALVGREGWYCPWR